MAQREWAFVANHRQGPDPIKCTSYIILLRHFKFYFSAVIDSARRFIFPHFVVRLAWARGRLDRDRSSPVAPRPPPLTHYRDASRDTRAAEPSATRDGVDSRGVEYGMYLMYEGNDQLDLWWAVLRACRRPGPPRHARAPAETTWLTERERYTGADQPVTQATGRRSRPTRPDLTGQAVGTSDRRPRHRRPNAV